MILGLALTGHITEGKQMQENVKTIYRYRIWKTEEGYKLDEEMQVSDVLDFMVETFHKEDEVYTIMADDEDGPVFMIFCDNFSKMVSFIQGIKMALRFDELFSIEIPEG